MHGPRHGAGCISTPLIGTMPSVGSRPTVGLRPTQPLSELGQVTGSTRPFRCRRRSGVSPPATAAPDPDDDPPALRSSAHGLPVRPPSADQPLVDRVDRMFAHSDRFVAPRTMSPASRRRPTSGASRLTVRSASAHDPAEPGRPTASMLSLISTGTPCDPARGRRCARRRGSPRPRAPPGEREHRSEMRLSRPVERSDPVEQGAREATDVVDRWRARLRARCRRSGECCRGGVGVARADQWTPQISEDGTTRGPSSEICESPPISPEQPSPVLGWVPPDDGSPNSETISLPAARRRSLSPRALLDRIAALDAPGETHLRAVLALAPGALEGRGEPRRRAHCGQRVALPCTVSRC